LTDPTNPTPASPAPPEPSLSPAVSARALSWWLGLMALGGMMFGMYGAQRPFGEGLITHPFTIFCGLGLAGLLILRFAGDRPLVSDRFLVAGVVVGIASYFLGVWFGTELLVIR
jgi:FtsH-binding integral membrane protein